MSLAWWSWFVKLPSQPVSRSRRPRRKVVRRPGLEHLEDRLTPTTFVWQGGTFVNGVQRWSDGANWVGNNAPNNGADLVFPDSVATFNKTSLVNNQLSAVDSIFFSHPTFPPATPGGFFISGNGLEVTGQFNNGVGVSDIGKSGSGDTISFPIALPGTVVFSVDQGSNLTLQEAVTDFPPAGVPGGLTLQGDRNGGGTLQLLAANTNTYTGPTTVSGGILDVDGVQPQSPVLVGSSGTLGGTGTVGSVTVAANGTINPAGPGPAGTLTVSGNVQFNAGSIFAVDLNGTTSADYDRLNVTGSVNVTGSASITVNSSGLSAPPHTRFTIVQANGGVTGAAFTVATSPFFLVPSSSNNTVVLDPPFAVANLTVAATPSSTVALGQPVTFTASLDTAQGTPTGSVTFSDGGHALATVPLNGNAAATFTTTSLSVGSHQIGVAYSGDSTFSPTAEPLASGLSVVNEATTTTNVGALPATVTFGQSLNLTATVTASSGTPGGSVTFFDNGTSLGTAPLSGGHTTLPASLALGAHTITASYGGDSSDASSQSSNSATVTVEVPTMTGVAAAPTSADVGQMVMLTATVSASSGTPTGTVTFYDNGTSLGTGTLNGGQATFPATFQTTGSHSITAAYAGNGTDAGSQSSTAVVVTVVNPTPTPTPTTTTVSAAPASVASGQQVTLTATVSASSGTPTGSVTFSDNGTSLGTAPLSGGHATLPASLALGSHTITASYGGDSTFAASQSSASASVTVTAPPVTPPVTPPAPTLGTDLTSALRIIVGRPIFRAGHGVQKVTISKRNRSPLSGPLALLLSGLSSRATLLNAAGTFQGSPYLTFSLTGTNRVVLFLQFTAPGARAAGFSPHVLSVIQPSAGGAD
jgi:autotransporter-associated beta strand protein